jgi:hypothetical protein
MANTSFIPFHIFILNCKIFNFYKNVDAFSQGSGVLVRMKLKSYAIQRFCFFGSSQAP